jgi:hypothetical protein
VGLLRDLFSPRTTTSEQRQLCYQYAKTRSPIIKSKIQAGKQCGRLD